VCNESDIPVEEPFTVSFYIDGREAYAAVVGENLTGKSYRAWLDEEFSFSEGEHTLLFAVDVWDEVAETNEDDNSIEMNFSWSALWPGVYKQMFGCDGDDTVRLLKRLRDDVLMAGREGRACVRMLYRQSWEIALLLLSDTELRKQTADVINQMLPEAACLADGETILLSRSKLASCEALLDRFAACGGPNVRSLAGGLKAKIREGALFGELGIQTE
jgi:hypothetical protein